MTRSYQAAVGVIALMAALSICRADTESRGQFTSSDYKFAAAATKGGAFEVNLGKLAQDKSADDGVKQFGQHMVQDHGNAGKDLDLIVSKKGAMLSSEPTAHQQRELNKLSKLSGPEFDKAYASLMVRAHKADLKEFKNAAQYAEDADLKAFAAKTVPMIEDHLKMAQDLDARFNTKLTENR